MVAVSLRFDLRIPPMAQTTFAAQHRACLEMASWAERIGATTVVFSEHHGDPAGYTPAPLTLAAAVLGRTDRIGVSVSALLAPLHDPLRVAEQLAVLDNLGPGRLSVILGAGYRKAEFAISGVVRSQRGALLEEAVAVFKEAFTGEPFTWRGREVLVTPPPATPGGPRLLMGGKSEIGARRAARMRLPFSPASGDPALAAAYRDECARIGYTDGFVTGLGDRPAAPGFVMISEDPEKTWAEIGPLAMHDAETYASWQDDAVRSSWVVPNLASLDELRASGRYVVVTPEECVELANRCGSLSLHPLMGGIRPESAWESLSLLENRVLPQLAFS